MTLLDVWNFLKDHIGIVIIALLSCIEVSKIKINPWSALLKWAGNIILGDVKKDITCLSKNMDDMSLQIEGIKEEGQEFEARAARNRILSFGDEVYKGVRHSKEFFDHILTDISFYKRYCQEHPDFQNDMTVLTVEHIEECYRKCLQEHDFLS